MLCGWTTPRKGERLSPLVIGQLFYSPVAYQEWGRTVLPPFHVGEKGHPDSLIADWSII